MSTEASPFDRLPLELIAMIAGYCVSHARLRQLRLCVKMLETSRTFACCLAYPHQDMWPGATEVRRMWRTEEEVKRALKLHMDERAWRAAWHSAPLRDALLDGCRKVWPVRITREFGVDWHCERRKFYHIRRWFPMLSELSGWDAWLTELEARRRRRANSHRITEYFSVI